MIGGWAGIAHGLPRTTLDVDLFVRPTTTNVQRLVDALGEVGFGTARELAAADVLARHVFLFADQIRVDIFMRPWGLGDFQDCWQRRREAEFDAVRIPFLGIDDLLRSKRTDRERDRRDSEALREIARRRDQR